jgi:ureidoglycolate lyase
MTHDKPLQRRRLKLETATPEALAPFGALLGRRADLRIVPIDYYAGSVVLSRPVNYECSSNTELSLATLQRRPFQVHYLERHFQHTQTFIPLGGKPFVAVFAPPSDAPLPDPEAVRAFRFDGSAGFCLHRGTWHEFPFPLEDNTDMIVVLSSQTTIDLQRREDNGIEASGPDLDKKDMTLRLNTVFEIDA